MKKSPGIGGGAGPLLAATLLLLVLVAVPSGCGGEAGKPAADTTAGQPGTTATTPPPAASTSQPPITPSSATQTTVAPTMTSAAGASTTTPGGPPTLADVEGYRQWLKMNLEPVQGRTHGLTDIYVNQERVAIAPDGTLAFPFPDGTVIVKEQVEGTLVAIMRKTVGIDPGHGDWQWIEYRTDGGVVGQDAGCWTCHGDARSSDWVFTSLATP